MKLLRPIIYFASVLAFAWLAGMQPVRGPWQASVIAFALFAGWVGVFQNRVTGSEAAGNRYDGNYVPGATNQPKPPTAAIDRTPRVTDLPPS